MNSRVKIGLMAAGIASVLPVTTLISSWSRASEKSDEPFPFAELARLDRDVQKRFSVVPDEGFGVNRITGKDHNFYAPTTQAEKETIAALQNR